MPEDNHLAPLGHPSLISAERRITVPKSVEIGEIDAFGQFRTLWDLLVKHQWLILAVTVVLTALVAFYSFKMQPVYQATCRVDVESETPLLQSLNDLFKRATLTMRSWPRRSASCRATNWHGIRSRSWAWAERRRPVVRLLVFPWRCKLPLSGHSRDASMWSGPKKPA